MKKFLFCLLIFYFNLRCLQAQVLASDSLALVALYNSTNGSGWTNNTNWLTGPVSSWFGITTSGVRVVKVDLVFNNMNGNIPPAIGNLSLLNHLNLSRNKFLGTTIPSEIGSLSDLIYLNLDRCGLQGDIPTSIGSLVQLKFLRLGYDYSGISNDGLQVNQLIYPSEIGSLINLESLSLGSSTIPTGYPGFIGTLTNLRELYLVGHQFTGAIPDEIGNLSNLRVLGINNSGFTSLPASIRNINTLRVLMVNYSPNLLLPSELQETTLDTLYLNGTTPVSINLNSLSTLKYLEIQDKGLTTLPLIPSSLVTLIANNNKITSVDVSGQSALKNLLLDHNDITEVPNISGTAISKLSLLYNYLQFDDLEGGPPVGVTNFIINPQKPFGVAQDINIEISNSLSISLLSPGTMNVYQWKRGTSNVGTNSNSYSVAAVTSIDEGYYTLNVTNSLVPGLTLTSAPINIYVIPVYPVVGALFDLVDGGDISRDGKDVNPTDNISRDSYSGSWGDFNNDGYDDLSTFGFGVENYIYKNNGNGTFTRILDSALSSKSGRNGVWGDANNDGFSDLFAPNQLQSSIFDNQDLKSSVFFNNGDETFNKVDIGEVYEAAAAGTWFDSDSDGDLDLITIRGGQSAKLYINNGNDSFTLLDNVFQTDSQWSITSVDIDNDNDLDVVLASDNTYERKRSIYRNEGNNIFTLLSGNLLMTDLSIERAIGGSWGDIDNDGDYDYFAIDSRTTSTDGSLFFINDGNGNFTRFTSLDVLGEKISGGRTSIFADFNNDGYIDLLCNNSNAPAGLFLFLNNGNGTFTKETSQTLKYQSPFSGASASDYDNDGFIDIFTAFFGADYNALYRNKGNSNNWLQIKLQGTTSNRAGIGAKVNIKANGFWQHRQVITTNGFANQNSQVQHFGIGNSTMIDSIVVLWPSGIRQYEVNIAGGQRILLVETLQPIIEVNNQGTGTPSGSNVQFTKTGVGVDQLKELEITNTGNATLVVTDVQVTGDFSLVSALPPPIDPGNTELLSIRFSPTGLGERTGTLTIISNGDIPVYTLRLVGEGDAEPEVYNVVTTNPNGKHDFLNIRNITLFPNNIVSIYDRWGNKVFEKSDYDNANGTFTGISDDGKELPEGTYYYVVDKNNGSKRITGFIMLKR